MSYESEHPYQNYDPNWDPDEVMKRLHQNANVITQKVSSSDFNGNTLVSMINQTATTIEIVASKINLVGAVTFLSDITSDLGMGTNGYITIEDGFLRSYNPSDLNTRASLSYEQLHFARGLGYGVIRVEPVGSGQLALGAGYSIQVQAPNFDFNNTTVSNLTGVDAAKLGGLSMTLNSAGTLTVTTDTGKTATFFADSWSG